MNVKNKEIKKKQTLYAILSAIFLTNALLAELIGIKIFSLEKSLDLPPFQLQTIGDFILDFNLTAGVIIWPVVFIITDIINEYFGKKGVKKITFITMGCIAYSFIAIYFVTLLVPADFWVEINTNRNSTNSFNINLAFQVIFSQGLSVILGSLIAFSIAQLLDVFIFQKIKKITKDSKIWLRATASTLISQLLDSFVVLFFAFYLLAPATNRWSFEQVLAVASINYLYKFVIAILITPFIYLSRAMIINYLGKETAQKMSDKASQDSKNFF